MIEKWNYFVYDLCEAKKKDVDEDSFHTLIETQLQHLGWAKFKGEISIMKIPLEIDNKLGARFIDKFLKENFSREGYCGLLRRTYSGIGSQAQ
ncbi:MAG: hypothetical protein E7107_03380 [Prevotella sp.]|jgi:hypothetical protein|nr:hypothetical protein [Prevotella sp.]